MTAPLLDGEIYLGDIDVQADLRDGGVEMPTERLLALLAAAVEPAALDRLRIELANQPRIRGGELGTSGIRIRYAPEAVSIILDIPYAARLTKRLSVAGVTEVSGTGFERPARLSAYVNAIGTLHYVRASAQQDEVQGAIYLDGAARVGGVVAETDGTWEINGQTHRFSRRGSRLVYDFPEQALRLSAGDLLTTGRGFQVTSPIAGLSLVKSFGILQPQKIIRPSGRGSFALERPSIVEVYVNDRLASRVELPPGNYDLRDLPYTQGTNQVRLVVRDGSGREETLRFDQYFDLNQLSRGISEFSVYAGVYAPTTGLSPHYSGNWVITGYYRYGLSNWLTVEGNLQADANGAMAGASGVLATAMGSFRLDLAASEHGSKGHGFAGLLAFQRLLGSQERASNSVSFSIEGASRDFMPVGQSVQTNPYKWRFNVDYLHSFSSRLSAGLGFNKSIGWNELYGSDRYRANLNWSITPSLRFWADAFYTGSTPALASEKAIRIGLRATLGQRGTASIEHDTQNGSTRLSYQASHGNGVGSYNLFGELDNSSGNTNLAFDGSYIANRAEIGANHYSNLDGGGGSSSTLRLGAAVAFADGAVSFGPPIHDSFAILQRHRTLKGSNIEVDPTDATYMAATGALGTAVRGNLTSYVDRTITIQSPDAPPTAELGAGAFRVMPPYRSGYRMMVGSDYSISTIGQLLDADGTPLSLVVGQAKEDGVANGVTVELFTNAAGRFGASGLRSGRWRLVFSTATPTEYILDIPAQSAPVFNAGVLKPQGEKP